MNRDNPNIVHIIVRYYIYINIPPVRLETLENVKWLYISSNPMV